METKIQYSCKRCPTSMILEGHSFQWDVLDKASFDANAWREHLWDELAAIPGLCERCIDLEAAEKKRANNVDWVHPVSMNDWGVDYYYAVYDRVECMTGSYFSWQACPYPHIKHGDRCEIKWPDGTVGMATIREGSRNNVLINDMGNDYHTSTSQMFVEQSIKGTTSLVPLVGSGIMMRPSQPRPVSSATVPEPPHDKQ